MEPNDESLFSLVMHKVIHIVHRLVDKDPSRRAGYAPDEAAAEIGKSSQKKDRTDWLRGLISSGR
jgi:hypothetical protein